MKLIVPAMLIAISAFCTQVEAGLFSFCRSSCGENSTRCCEPECKSVKVKKKGWKTECEEVVLPPVCIPSCKDILRNMCPGNSHCGSGSCGQDSCCEAGCTPGCSPCSLPTKSCGNGLLGKLLAKHAKCRVRCVSRLKADNHETEETKIEWKVQHRCGGCAVDGCTSCGDHCIIQ